MNKYSTIKHIVDSQGARIFSVSFVKKDGSNRTMLVQNAATKTHVKGESASERAKQAAATRKVNNPNLLNVYDIHKHAIRSINMDTVYRIAGQGKVLYAQAD